MLKPIDKSLKPKRSKKKPTDNPREVVIAKIFFLITLVIAALLFSRLAAERPVVKPPKKKPVNVTVLGTQIQKETAQAAGQTLDAAQKKAAILREEVQNQLEQLLTEKRGEIESSVSAIIFDSTLKPLIDRFNQLPPEQKEEVKQAICK